MALSTDLEEYAAIGALRVAPGDDLAGLERGGLGLFAVDFICRVYMKKQDIIC